MSEAIGSKMRLARGVRVCLLTSVFLLSACAGATESASPAAYPDVPEIRPGLLAGYLAAEANVDSLALLPPPPAEGSAAFELDREVSRRALTERGTPRWELATSDAELMFPAAASTFECALGIELGEQSTPRLYMLLRRSLADAGLATYGAKTRYQRARPFMSNDEPTCTPDEEEMLRHDGSYPSGHTAVGWAWALILAELLPERADAILARGIEFGESRIVCNVHWQSDVTAGRIVAAGTVAILHDDAQFQSDMAEAGREIREARERGEVPAGSCGAVAPEAGPAEDSPPAGG